MEAPRRPCAPPTPIVLLLPLIFLLSHFPCSSAESPLYQICGSDRNYAANSTYQSNLNLLLSSLASNASSSGTGFSTDIVGTSPNQISGLVLCRGDTNATTCRSCLDLAGQDTQQLCPDNKDATIWYDDCLLRYSNQHFLNSTDNSQQVFMWNVKNVSGQTFIGWDGHNASVRNYFNSFLNTLMSDISNLSAYDTTNMYATGEIDFINPFPTVYGLVQCTPDLSQLQCHGCLQGLMGQMLQWFDGRQGGRMLGVRCNLRYEVYTFFDGVPMQKITYLEASPLQLPASPPMPPQNPSANPGAPPLLVPPSAAASKGGKRKIQLIAITISLALLLSCSLLCFLWLKRQKNKGQSTVRKLPKLASVAHDALMLWRTEDSSVEFSLFDFSRIVEATNNFSTENKLGQGGFGPVYKGQLLDGQEIAVKRLAAHSGQGMVEFQNEIHLIAKLQHRNLVKLLGCCLQGEEKILIYEYMPNKSLDFFLFDQTMATVLDWNKRSVIIEGIAQGLLYLHKHSRLRIIHRDLKASNILLDSDMNPKISDFGLARIFGSNETQGSTERVVGTFGYMAPEYASEGLFSVKSDVFSYGVLLLEIISGKRNAGFHQHGKHLNLLGYAWELWKERKWHELIDPSMRGEYRENEMLRCINTALICVQENAMDRPTMSDIVAMLNREGTTLPEPKHPAFFNVRIRGEGQEDRSDLAENCSINTVTISTPRGR